MVHFIGYCSLRYLLRPWITEIPKKNIHDINQDSRMIKPGDLFVAIAGYKTDGRNFITQAVNRGAAAILAEVTDKKHHGTINYLNNIPIIYINQLSHKLSEIAGRFYGNPANNLQLIGVTGTNGKTTVTHLIAQWMTLLGQVSGLMGTITNSIYGQLIPTNNTTSSAIKTQRILYKLWKQGATTVAMEISSHGLVQNRVLAIPFEVGVFTNLSRDHLDYHISMKKYALAKWKLFSQHIVNKSILNIDDKLSLIWLKNLPKAIVVSLDNKKYHFNKHKFLYAKEIYYSHNNTYIKFDSSWGSGELNTNLIGKFNAINLLLALTTLIALNNPLNDLIEQAAYLQPICGRMEVFKTLNMPTVVVDFAHTPNALEEILKTLRLHFKGKICSLFGCGGDRDKGKRSLMGTIAERLSDMVIITSDNPRYESIENINKDILSGFQAPKAAYIIPNRLQAITKTINMLQPSDILLVAGKGHESYQIINDKYILHSDRDIVANCLGIKI